MAVDRQQRTSQLIDEALADVANPNAAVSTIVEKAIRIARFRGDGPSLVWLMMEIRPVGDESSKTRAIEELLPYFESEDVLRRVWSQGVEALIVRRKVDDPEGERMAAMSVREMEEHVVAMNDVLADARETRRQGDYTLVEAEGAVQLRIAQVRQILARTRSLVQDYLSRVEQELFVDVTVAAIFAEQQAYADARLRELAPAAFDQLALACQRRAEGDVESRSQALTSCRRALKSVADALYPPPERPVIGADGVERTLTDAMYISRLLQFVFEQRKGSVDLDAEVLRADVAHLADRLEALNDLASKGVHATVSELEVNQAIIHTYLAIADVLRLAATEAV